MLVLYVISGFVGGLGVATGVFWLMSKPSTKCADGFCSSRLDQRCAGGNCSHHCSVNCRGRCLDAWAKSDEALVTAKHALEKARR